MGERTFYINRPRIIQREVSAKEQNVRQLPFKKKIYTVIKTLGAKPRQEDSLFALAEKGERP